MWTALLMPPALHAEPTDQAPTLHLDGVVLTWMSTAEDGQTHLTLRCSARWENPGSPLSGQTAFGGVFDGVWLVAVDAEGREVVRRAYTHHQSPHSQGRPITLPAGQTTAFLSFPLEGVHLGQLAQVRLEGGLVGSAAVSADQATQWQSVQVFR